jgi:hypothetical protein
MVSLAVADNAEAEVRAEYTAMLWHAVVLVAAIDARTVKRRRVGIQLDSGVLLTPDEVVTMGFVPGPGRNKGGYGGDYHEWVYAP